MIDRAALLIGVRSYDGDLFDAIPHVVTADIDRMSDALTQSGYATTSCGVDDGDAATFNRISGAMKKAFREAPAGGTLVVYYSGHGVVVDGRSYLVPQDAYRGVSGVDPESLVPLVPRGLDECPARLVVFFVDACRNDLSGALDLPLGGELPYPPDGAFVMVTSCGPGERSGYGGDGSYFTQALAEALDRRSPARTVDEVTTAVAKRLGRLGALSDDIRQTPRAAFSQSGLSGHTVGSSVLCDGDKVGELWRTAAGSTPLWQRSAADPAVTDATRKAVLGVVDSCARHWLDARALLTDKAGLSDRWSMPEYAIRVLARLHDLLPPDAQLTAAELAAAVAAPFLREVALSEGLILAAGIDPQDFSRTYGDGARGDLEITHDMHEHVWRRAEGLARRGRLEARDILAMWLVHRWLAGRSSLWGNAAVAGLIERIGAAATPGSGFTARELCGHLRILTVCVDGDYDDEGLRTKLKEVVFEPRFQTLGAIIWLSGVLAADSRRMPSVIVDHVGVTDGLSLGALHEAIGEMEWVRDGDELALRSVCDHPALFTVFEGIAKRAARVRRTLREFALHPDLARSLPATITDAHLRPEKADGVPAFDTPVLTFRLSDEKVRELLMGRQLYGEPDLAIRELYQNALDACRYRRTRREYLGGRGHDTMPWTGEITIRQAVENGRPYVECADNGVGMTAEVLKNTFANAGERFIYRPAFRAEYARWQEEDPPLELIPNSQFGIGVFSYFMIAEEIVIWTWPTNENDVAAPHGHCVRIASSGSLFQITPADRPAGGGTVVRLYLTGDESISAVKTMRRLLRVAEFTVTVAEANGAEEAWAPEELRYPGASVTPLPHGDDFWWVSGEGGLAADGIHTNEERFGMVVNLRGRRRPRFTVDRNRLRRWDRDWIDQQVTESLPALADWPGLSFNWLWKVAMTTPRIAEKIFGWLVEHDRSLAVEGSWAYGTAPPAGRVGCLPVDRHLFSGELNGWTGGFPWLTAWRVAAWRGFATFDFMEHLAVPQSLDGYPLVRPLDADVIDKIYELGSRSGGGRPDLSDLLAAAADEEESPAERLRRLKRFAIAGLDLSAARDIPPVRYRFDDGEPQPGQEIENRDLLAATLAWTRPGCSPGRTCGSWLALASMRLHVPVNEVIQRATRLVPPTWTPPSPQIVSAMGHHVFTATEIDMITLAHVADEAWVDADISPALVMHVSATQGRSVPEVLAEFDRFAPLGYAVMGRHLFPGDLEPIEHAALLHVESMPTALSALHLTLLAHRHRTTVQKVHENLGRLAAAGFLSLPDLRLDAEMVPTDDEVEIVNRELFIYDFRTNGRKLARGWLAFRKLASFVYSSDPGDIPARLEASRRLLEMADPGRPVTMPEIIGLTESLEDTIASAVACYRRLLPQTADLSQIPPSAEKSDVKFERYNDFWALVDTSRVRYLEEGETAWGIKPYDIASSAQGEHLSIPAFLDRLEPFRSFGAPLPTLTDAVREDLASHTIDKFDARILMTVDEDGMGVPVESVTPLRLVQTAGRFGWTLAETYTRLARFIPLGLDVQVTTDACDDSTVQWQDLLVLTVHLDGQEPALRGAVDDAHLTAAAEEIDETVAQVRQRLARYAGLMGFTLGPATAP